MQFDLDIKVPKNLKNPVMLVGLPGIGLVGRIAIEYIAVELKAQKIADISGSLFPPIAIAYQDGLIKRISNEVYHYKTKNRDFFFLTGDVQPLIGDQNYSEQHYYFAKNILDIAKKLSVKELYTFAGLDIGDARITKKPVLYYATSSKSHQSLFKKLKIKPAKEDLTISGAAGILPTLSSLYDIEGSCILSETSNKLIYGDFDSAKTIVTFLSKQFKINVKLNGIEKEAKKIKKAFEQIVLELKKISSEQNKPEQNLSYIR